MSYLIKNCEGNEMTHDRAVVNSVRLHDMKAGPSDPGFLLHSVPKPFTTGTLLFHCRSGDSP